MAEKITTLVLDFSASGGADSCSGLQLAFPQEEVAAGDVVEIRLWGASPELLAGWELRRGLVGMGLGALRQVSGKHAATGEPHTEQIDFAEGFQKQLAYPFLSIDSVIALTELYYQEDEGGHGEAVVWASRGEYVTPRFMRQGYSCLKAVDGVPLYGSVQATVRRTPHYRVWQWTAPAQSPGDQWFFLYQGGVLQNKFAVAVPDLAVAGAVYKTVTLKVMDKCTKAGIAGATVYVDGALAGVTGAGGTITLTDVATGDHGIRVVAEGYIATDEDELNNGSFTVY